jgi:hypothetical protein
MSELLQFGKTTIKIPEKMLLIRDGKESLQDVITKAGNLATRNKEKSIKFEKTKQSNITVIQEPLIKTKKKQREIKPKVPKVKTVPIPQETEYIIMPDFNHLFKDTDEQKTIKEKNKKKQLEKSKEELILDAWDNDNIPDVMLELEPKIFSNINKKVLESIDKKKLIKVPKLAVFLNDYIDKIFKDNKGFKNPAVALNIIIDGLVVISKYFGAKKFVRGDYTDYLPLFNEENQKIIKTYFENI